MPLPPGVLPVLFEQIVRLGGSERTGREPFLIVEVRIARITGPRIAHFDRFLHLVGPDQHRVAVDFRIGPHEVAVLARDRE